MHDQRLETLDLKSDILKKLFRHEITIQDITENDFQLNIKQKGVDMKIGVDISSLAYVCGNS